MLLSQGGGGGVQVLLLPLWRHLHLARGGGEAAKGQVWTRHLAPAALAGTRPSSPSQFIACPAGHVMPDGIVFFLHPPWLGRETRAVGSGHHAWALSIGVGGGGGWHKASVSDCLPLAAPIGLSPLLILTLCGSKRVLVGEGGGV